MRRLLPALLVLATVIGLVPAAAAASADEPWDGLRAGVGVADATWHVGAAAGQYTDYRDPADELSGGDIDPSFHATSKENSYGVASRLTIRAIVVEGSNGQRVALVKSDNYLAQDHLLRRVGQLLDEAGSQVTYDTILHAATHNHSSPYYATPSWGVWLFEDVVDLRMFEYQARAMADAILQAEADLAPARMGATTVKHSLFKGNIMRPQTADDGSPAGFPNDYGDQDLTLLRFDRRTDAGYEPMAVWMNWGQHPESLDSYDLITADYLGPLERFVERDTGATLVFSQGDVGSAEGPYEGWNRGRMDDGTLVAWAHVGHAQMERGARLLADAVVEGFEEIGRGEGTVPVRHRRAGRGDQRLGPRPGQPPVPERVQLPHRDHAGRRPGHPGRRAARLPAHHRRRPALAAVRQPAGPRHPRARPVRRAGLHRRRGERPAAAAGPAPRGRAHRVVRLRGPGRPHPQLQEPRQRRGRRHPRRVRLGRRRAHHLRAAPDGDWQCVYDDPDAHGHREWTFDDAAYRRWQAQVHNPADGWDALDYLPWANAEPTDPAAIKGNFTDEELDEDTGFPLVVGVGHAGDYNGYTVSYREYQAYDHYRKALTSYGPHTADYMVTWMVRMARSLTDPGYAWEDQLLAGDPTTLARGEADEARQLATSQALGRAAGAAYDAWQAALPDDVGPAAVLTEPEDITRFDGAFVTWRGGSNAVDNPVVTVERQVDGVWQPYADMSGEVQTMVDLPNGANAVLDTYSGGQEWIWTAGFEAFTGGPNPELATTPAGTYRFVVDGHIRTGGATEPYALASEPFTVAPWDGIAAPQLSLDGDLAVATLAPTHRYPRTYESPFPYVADDGRGRLVDENGQPAPDDLTVCHTCSFRAWAFEGRVADVDLTVTHRNGRIDAGRHGGGR